MDSELEQLKRLNLVEIAQIWAYEIDQRRSTKAAVAMRKGAHKVVIGQAEDGHSIYYSVDGSNESGSALDFVQHRLSEAGQPSSLGHVRRELRGGPREAERGQKKAIPKPMHCSRSRIQAEAEIRSWKPAGIHPYLKSRGLNQIQTDPRFQGHILIDSRRNVCFPHQDRIGWCGAEVKNFSFNGQIKGGEKGLWLSMLSQQDTRQIICESAIDALSFHLLHGDCHTRYASIGGALSSKQRDLIQGLLQKSKAQGREIIIAVDNDDQGDKYESEIRELAPVGAQIMRKLPKLKDFNEDLQP